MRSVLKRREASRLFALRAFDRVRAVWTFIAFMSHVSSRDRRVRSHLCLNEQPDWFLLYLLADHQMISISARTVETIAGSFPIVK